MEKTTICSIEIVTFTNGERSLIKTQGRYAEETDGFTISYEHEGDRSRLIAHGQTFLMQRTGENELSMTLCEGVRGELVLGVGMNYGTVPVTTHRCRIRNVRDGWRISLAYALNFEQESQIFHINIAVKYISEEQ